jgi:lactoylglutathione lyase
MQGLRTTIYQVPDLAAAKAWYTQAFGKAPYFDEPFYVGFNIGGYELGLHPEGDIPLAKSTNVVSYWGVGEDVQAVFDRLLELGGTAHEAPTNVGGPLVVATVLDPWGNPIGLIYNPTFPNKL